MLLGSEVMQIKVKDFIEKLKIRLIGTKRFWPIRKKTCSKTSIKRFSR